MPDINPLLLAGIIAGLVLLTVLIGVGVGFLVVRSSTRARQVPAAAGLAPSLLDSDHVRSAEARAQEVLEQARQDADRVLKDAELKTRDEAFRRREELTRELDAARAELREQERRTEKREDAAVEKAKELTRKERHTEQLQKKLADRKEVVEKKAKDLEELIEQETRKLHDITGLSREQAEKLLLDRLERELSAEVAGRIQKHTDRLKADAEAKAREVIATAIQRYAAEHTTDTTVSTVDIPDDNMKGRIIGREGRNIRTFEKCTGVDVIVDDTPGVVVVSAFDNIRRETARLALTKLIQDGRIHPTRIEEVVTETQTEMDAHILEIGKNAVLDADVAMPHEKIVQLLGRLKFRTSYSQNVLQHSLEVAHLCGLMAAELGLNPQLARRCGLLHDVGKAADHEMEGGHPKVGAELAKRYGETSKEVLHAIVGHHDDVTVDNIYTVLVSAADAISASRPGARRETLEKYVKRMEELEAVACGFPEVETAFAIQAGRELRVIASASRTTDADALRVCRDIARAIEQQLDYPGEIKVTVIRETRALEVAK
ncbi:MAG TPA: ribonuclease Y [Fimbriiglobus sp.]|nr:ribonuclease Y [Fimbriiglobus sp.]